MPRNAVERKPSGVEREKKRILNDHRLICPLALAEGHFKSIPMQVKIIHEARMQLRYLRIGFFLFRFYFREGKKESSVKCVLMESSTERQA